VVNLGNYDFGPEYDEGYYAIPTRNMLRDPINLVYPTFLVKGDIKILSDIPPGLPWIGYIFINIFGINELSFRLVSIIFGVLSVCMFYLLVKLFDKKIAAISSIILASFPLHVAFSRVYIPHLVELFFCLLISYLFIKGIEEGNRKLIFINIPLIAFNFMLRLWASLLPLIGILFWIIIKYRKTRTKHLRLSLVSFVVGFLFSFTWPIVVWLTPNYYTGFFNHFDYYGTFSSPIRSVWENIFIEMGIKFFPLTDFNLIERLFYVYWNAGNLTFNYLVSGINIVYPLLIICGLFLIFYRIGKTKSSKIIEDRTTGFYVFWLLWLLFYLPVHLCIIHSLQHLVILTPAFSFFMGVGLLRIYGVFKIFIHEYLANFFAISIIFVLLISPIIMIFTGNEVLYRTYYREMGEYVKPKIVGYEYSAICRYFPEFTYYTEKMCLATHTLKILKNPISWYIKNKDVRFVILKARPSPLKEEDMRWVINNCKNVDKEAGVPKESYHHLYDCVIAQE
jgi:4-amino-4-deoxy-L-arabinose transferase-like glycosyltransferase